MTLPPKILIVDDEPFNIDYLEQELGEADYELFRAANGHEALSCVERHAPDLILLDIMMPGMDGFEVLRRLKAAAATHDIPVIVISASNNLESVVKGIRLGAEDYLPKPFEPVLLHARIGSCLEKKRLHDLEHRYLQALQDEMDIARDIQKGFLPSELPQVPGWELAAYFKAAREVAGDFYDAFLLPDGSLVAVIGDVCGKGVGAALFMTLFRSLIRGTFTTEGLRHEESTEPSTAQRLHQVVSSTNRYVAETHAEANMFATVFIGVYEPQEGRVMYVNCGHEPPLWYHNGDRSVELRPTGPALGVIPDACFSTTEIIMDEGDLMLAFTDGIPDALDAAGRCFGKEGLTALLEDSQGTAASTISSIQAALGRFVGDADPFDDITLLSVRRTPA